MTPTVQVAKKGNLVTVLFTLHERPWTTNYERKGNRWIRSQKTSEWRQLFGWLAKAQRLPCLCDVTIEVHLEQKGRLQDVGSCSPAIKASIDGLVDAGLMVDDNPENLHKLVFFAPVRAKHDKVTIVVSGKVKGDE